MRPLPLESEFGFSSFYLKLVEHIKTKDTDWIFTILRLHISDEGNQTKATDPIGWNDQKSRDTAKMADVLQCVCVWIQELENSLQKVLVEGVETRPLQ